jgi:hypothetical protein
MTVLIGSWEFEGPFDRRDVLRREPGLYATLIQSGEDYELVELNESPNIRATFEALQEMTPQQNSLSIAVYYCSDLSDGLRDGLVELVLKEFHLASDFETKSGKSAPLSHTELLKAMNM